MYHVHCTFVPSGTKVINIIINMIFRTIVMSCHISFISCMYSIITTIVSTVLHVYTFVPSKVHVYICKTLYARK